uniref:acyl-CoA reductase n=2 Tax=Flavobacterium sp. TaxID=239 RepID=UPI0040497B1D
MTQIDKINSFVQLGNFLRQFNLEENQKNPKVLYNDPYFEDFNALIHLSKHHNGWFTPSEVYFSIQQWAEALTEHNLSTWLKPYELEDVKPKKIAIILAGNIPLVGFHDFLSVLISGHKVLVKLSSNDQKLLPFLAKYLLAINTAWETYINFSDKKLTDFDAIIATGSNNTSRYFDYYFKNYPSIIRKNRNSVAILNGHETKEDFHHLGQDIFRYFGLGCRNVSKIYVPKDYDFTLFFESIYAYGPIIHEQKYANNYDYNKTVYLMSQFKLLDNEFLILKEDTGFSSPIATLFYEYYDDLETLNTELQAISEQIQCFVSNNLIANSIPFGSSQKPNLWDYADGIDTIEFLKNL